MEIRRLKTFPENVPPMPRPDNDNEPLLRADYRNDLENKNAEALESIKKNDWLHFQKMTKSLNRRVNGLLAFMRRGSIRDDVKSAVEEMEKQGVSLEALMTRMRESDHGNWVDEPETFLAIGEMIVRNVEFLKQNGRSISPEALEEARRFRSYFANVA